MYYYIYINNTTVGPMTKAQLLSYPVNENTQVSTDNMNWQPLYTYPDLVSALSHNANYKSDMASKKTLCGIMAILLGGLGIHYFIMGKTTAGLLTILFSIISCGIYPILMFIQGIMILTMSESDFVRKYIDSNSTYPLF